MIKMPNFEVVDREGLARIAKEMRRYAIEHPVTDYDAFAVEAMKPQEGLVQERLKEGVVRCRGAVPDVLAPFTRFICFKGAQLQIYYMHITDPKIVVPVRQLNIVDTFGLPLGFLLKEDGIKTLLGEFVNTASQIDVRKTPPHVLMVIQPIPAVDDAHERHYRKRE